VNSAGTGGTDFTPPYTGTQPKTIGDIDSAGLLMFINLLNWKEFIGMIRKFKDIILSMVAVSVVYTSVAYLGFCHEGGRL